MSQFSKQMEAYIMQRGVNYVQLSRCTRIDCTLLHHLVRGDRKLTGTEQVERLAEARSLFPAERKERTRLGRIARMGEEVYYRRLAVHNMMLRASPEGPLLAEPAADWGKASLPPVCQGVIQVWALLKQLIDRECALPSGYVDFVGNRTIRFCCSCCKLTLPAGTFLSAI